MGIKLFDIMLWHITLLIEISQIGGIGVLQPYTVKKSCSLILTLVVRDVPTASCATASLTAAWGGARTIPDLVHMSLQRVKLVPLEP